MNHWWSCKYRQGNSGTLVVRAPLLFCVLTLAASAVFAQAASQPPAPSGRVSGEQQQPKASQPVQSSAPEQRGTARAPLFIQSIPAAESASDAAHKVYEHHEKPTLDRWLTGSTVALAVFTLVLAIFTALMWVATYRLALHSKKTGDQQATDTKAALEIARDAANASKKSADASLIALRPWLSCKVEITEPLSFNEAGDPIFKITFIVENVGKTPAMSVSLSFPTLNLFAPGVEHSILKLQRLASLNRGLGVPVKTPPGYHEPPPGVIVNPVGRVLFPGETHREHLAMPISKAQIVESCKDISPETHFWPELIVLVSYVYNLAETRADTGYVFTIKRNNGIPPFKLGETVPADEIRVELHQMWGGFAT